MPGIESVTMGHHLGVDAGGTSTRAVVLDSAGVAHGYGRSGSGNPISSGAAAAADSLQTAVAAALEGANLPGPAVSTTAVAMAGGSSVNHDQQVGDRITEAFVSTGVTAPVSIEPDVLALYFSGTPRPDGYALVSGTGAAAVRVHHGELAVSCDGLGWLLGDDGSGFWIGREVVRAVAADIDGRGPATTLTPVLVAALDLPPPAGSKPGERRELLRRLVNEVYALRPVQLARFAPLAFEVVQSDDDAVATRIVTRAGRALAATLAAVATAGLDGPIVVGGSVLVNQASVRAMVAASWSDAGHRGPLVVIEDGLVGAAVLALRHAGVHVDATVFDTVTESLALLR